MDLDVDLVAPPSSSEIFRWSSGKVYEIVQGRNGKAYCTCPASTFSMPPKSCKHLDCLSSALALLRRAGLSVSVLVAYGVVGDEPEPEPELTEAKPTRFFRLGTERRST